MRFLKYLSSVVFLTIVLAQMSAADHGGFRLPDPYSDEIAMAIPTTVAVSDTIPIKDTDGAWTDDDYYNPFDITPSSVTQEVEYDPTSGNYIILEKIGDEYYRTPSYMTFEEYMEWNKKRQERDYFSELAGLNTGKEKGSKLIVDPMDRIDIGSSLIDRLFGGTEVTIQPQGNVDLSFGFDYQNSNDETITQAQRRRIGFDFNMAIRMNVDGSIGEKLNLGFNYDTQSTFDFDRKIKLEYDSANFSEDDIIKKIEAGNVSLPLKSTLIQGAQSLFGLKTELQFGHLKVTALASQQKSKQNNLRIENGASIQEFEVLPAEYDENRHFFLSHYHRDSYEDALDNLPFINSSFRISNIEVWISTEGQSNGGGGSNNDFTQIAAIADLGEPLLENYTNDMSLFPPNMNLNDFADLKGRILPDNRVNGIYEAIKNDDMVKQQDLTVSVLRNDYGMNVTRDFEKFQARKLSSSEYTYHEQLGMLSLNIRLRPDQKLGVAYDYFYTAICDTVFHVGELANEGSTSTSYSDFNDPNPPPQDSVEAPKLFFVKLLKSSNPSTRSPMWDLMMKNVYSLRTSQLNAQDFEFDIFYDDPTDGAPKKFLPEPGFRDKTLLEMFGLDRLNEYNDPQQDGIFDFVEGVTVNPRNGTIIFPVLEPFGSSLADVLIVDNMGVLDSTLFRQYAYQEMYDTSATIARYNSGEQNRFIMKGKVKSAVSGEISLGPFVPEGSVRVSAGGVRLEEGRDYEIDYSLGRLRIINEAYLSQGTPINVSFEDNTVFSLQQKTMLGLRAEYEFSDNFNIGATYLRLFERPFTQKINVGNDPINNRVFGIDMEYSNEAPWLTNLVDKLPFFSTKEPSNINFALEGAVLKPGHSDAINLNDNDDSGVASIDDFEGAVSGFLIGSFNTNVWKLASTPAFRPESADTEGKLSSVNRAMLNWYSLDLNQTDPQNSYTRLLQQDELFQRDVNTGQGILNTFDLSFYPNERGPYNYDVPDGNIFTEGGGGVELTEDEQDIRLKNPEDRWGGIMRNFRNTDFEAANYQFIEFWMLNPYMDRPDGSEHTEMEDGRIEFHFGNVSEDILADNLQFFENGIPVDDEIIPVKQTGYGSAPLIVPVTQGFDRENGKLQDLGFDGIDDVEEGIRHSDYLDALGAEFNLQIPKKITGDPAGDNFIAFNDPDPDRANLDLLSKLKESSNPEGNLPDNANASGAQDFVRGNRLPDTEDMNGNNSLDQGESYYKYELPIRNDGGKLARISPYIRQQIEVPNPNNPAEPEIWYRVQIPLLATQDNAVGGISGFRAIQFMRIYMTGFSSPKTFRMAEMELVRNIWRAQEPKCRNSIDGENSGATFNVDDVGIEENSGDMPIGYVSPPNIKQEELFNTFSALRQDEKSLEMNFSNLEQDCEISINKLANINLTFYDKLQMFTHLQDSLGLLELEDGDISVFIRLGDDSEKNYYEYRVPLEVTRPEDIVAGTTDKKIIWPDQNFIDLDLNQLTALKIERNKANFSFTKVYQSTVNPRLRIIGNPSLADVREIEVGAHNSSDLTGNPRLLNGKMWINELRVAGFKEQAGYAATARLQMQMADLGELNFATTFTSEGWGGLDQKLEERNQFAQLDYDASTSLELSKLLPAGGMGLTIPFFAQYSRSVKSPKFEAYSEDLTFDEAVEAGEDRADVEDRSQETTTIKTFNFTNVKKAKSKDKKTSYPWDISNLSASYAYTQTKNTDPIIAEDKITEHTAGLDYNYSRKGGHIKPFKFIKNKKLKLISEFNFNLLPNSLTFGTTLNRKKSTRTYRLPDTPIFTFDDQRFVWERRYGLNWDLTKALKFTYKANATAVVDELRQIGVRTNPEDRDWVTESGENVTSEVDANPNFVSEYRNRNLRDLGRSKNYNHNITATYTLPFKLIPGMDWINAKADYKAGYRWQGGALITIDEIDTPLGNSISNSQTRSGNVTFSFDKLYSKIPYLKTIDKGKAGRKRTGRSRTRGKKKDLVAPGSDKKGDEKDKDKKEDTGPSTLEKILVRPLLALRDVKFSYKEDQSTFLPGFMPQSNLLGMSRGFAAPGWAFIGGIQPNLDASDPNNYLLSNVKNDYFNPSQNFSDEIIQKRRHNFDLKIGIEPFKDFDIDVIFRKDYQETHTEVFKNKNNPAAGEDIKFIQNAGYDFGSFEATYSGLSTLFKNNGDLYQNFIELREQVSNSLPNDPVVLLNGFSDDFPNYAEGFGPDNSNVLIPAFLGAYTNKTINDIDVNASIDETVKDYNFIPKPNWTLKYDGLSKLSMFKDVLSNFSLTHGYKSSIRVNRFSSQPEYDGEKAAFDQEKRTNGNYYSRVEVPTISIDEQFAPVLGISLKTKTDLQLDFEYRKSRRLDLGIAAGNLTEVLGTEYIAGFAYTIKDFQGFGKKKKSKRKKKDQEDDDKTDPLTKDKSKDKKRRGRGGNVNSTRGRNITMNFDFSYSDDVTWIYRFKEELGAQPQRGQVRIFINPYVDYEMNENLNLRFFFEYSKTKPYSRTSFDRTNMEGGITVQFKLN